MALRRNQDPAASTKPLTVNQHVLPISHVRWKVRWPVETYIPILNNVVFFLIPNVKKSTKLVEKVRNFENCFLITCISKFGKVHYNASLNSLCFRIIWEWRRWEFRCFGWHTGMQWYSKFLFCFIITDSDRFFDKGNSFFRWKWKSKPLKQ